MKESLRSDEKLAGKKQAMAKKLKHSVSEGTSKLNGKGEGYKQAGGSGFQKGGMPYDQINKDHKWSSNYKQNG